MIAKRSWIAAFVLMAGLACSATVEAQPNGRAWGYRRNQGASQAAYDNGYRQGFDRGRSDARSRHCAMVRGAAIMFRSPIRPANGSCRRSLRAESSATSARRT